MKIQKIILVLVLSALLLLCSGCNITATMPHSSDEYENGEWSVKELVEHFEELGFTDIEIEKYTTFDENNVNIQVVVADDSTSWFPSYRDFEKGETISTIRKIIIRTTTLNTVLTVKNSPEFAELIKMDSNSPEKSERIASFMQAHDGDYLEFDGTIIDWYDEMFWVSVSITIAVEDSDQMSFSWNLVSLSELGMTGEYHHDKYHAGLITEGMKVHVRAQIDYAEDGWSLEIDSMQIIE